MEIKDFNTNIDEQIANIEVGEVRRYHTGSLAADRVNSPSLDELATKLLHKSTGQYFVGEKDKPNQGTGEFCLFQYKEGDKYHYMAKRLKKELKLTVNNI